MNQPNEVLGAPVDTVDGRVVIVTGGAQGIGAQIARDFAATGAVVAVLDLQESDDADVVSFVCDITDAAQVDAAVAGIVERYGRIDTVVNNAGFVVRGSADRITEGEWDKTFAINVKGVFLLVRATLPHLRRSPIGSIVSVASQAGIRAEALLSPYCAAKAAVVHYTRALALELAPDLRVNAVCPGFVETEMARSSLAGVARETGREFDDVRNERMSVIPLRRFQQPADISAAVLFLASARAGEITGEILAVAGGQTL